MGVAKVEVRQDVVTEALADVDVAIEQSSVGDDVLQVIGLFFASVCTLGLFWVWFDTSRLVFGNFTDKDQDALRQAGRDIANDPKARPVLLATYKKLRRRYDDFRASEELQKLVHTALVRKNPAMAKTDKKELALAAAHITAGIESALSPQAPVPHAGEGFDRLTRELEATTPSPDQVSITQGQSFRRFGEILEKATRLDEKALDSGGVRLLGCLFGVCDRKGLASAGERLQRGIITGPEIAAMRKEALALPAGDRRMLATILRDLTTARDANTSPLSRVIDDPDGDFAKLLAELEATPPASAAEKASEETCARLLADVAALDFVLADIAEETKDALELADRDDADKTSADRSASLPLLKRPSHRIVLDGEQEDRLAALKTQLMLHLRASPGSVQQLARATLTSYMERIPSSATSPTLDVMRHLFSRKLPPKSNAA
ncbi:MAG: hypothetical protein IT381_09215 [Deltaproteobacteria bacterium]|nr:hypothetical protein [Deltaproteobacteria bacterium]